MTILLEVERLRGRDLLTARSPYSAEAVARAKSVDGARWSKPHGCWTFPLDLATYQAVRRAFPAVELSWRVKAWVRKAKIEMAELRKFHTAAGASLADLPIVRENYPTMWSAMCERGYQTQVVAFCKRVGNYYNASQPGTGKTIETLASIVESEVGPRVLVIAPKKAVQSTWPREIAKWLKADQPDYIDMLTVDSTRGSMDDRNRLLRDWNSVAAIEGQILHFTLINPEMLTWDFQCAYVKPGGKKCDGRSKSCPQRSTHDQLPYYPELFKIRWNAIILDETHKIMMNANERSGSVSGPGYGAQHLLEAAGCLKIGMSGTPFKGKPRRFWPVLHWLDKSKYRGQRKWTEMYFEMDSSNFFSKYAQPTDVFAPGREELFNADLDGIMIRHTKRELRAINPAWAPPEKLYVDVVLPMDPKQRKAYQGMLDDAAARVADGVIGAVGVLAERTRLKQFASATATASGGYAPALPSNKWDWIVEALEERGLMRKVGRGESVNDGSVKVVIASQYVKLLQLFGAELDRMGIKHLDVYGSSGSTRAVEEEWQSSQLHTRVLLLSIMAGGTSLTLDAADDLILVDETDNPDDGEQTEDRVHRTSRTDHQVTIYRLISAGTIDEAIAAGNLSADISQKAVLDGRRGVEFARKLLAGSEAV